jgi:hypothetical protein
VGRNGTATWSVACAAVLAISAPAGLARAQGSAQTGPSTDPPLILARGATLPDLTHGRPEMTAEQTIASARPHDEEDRLTSHLFHFDVEHPLIPRLLYVGADAGFALARAPAERRVSFVGSQPQLFGRIVHVEPHDKYALGAGLGIIAPIFKYDDRQDSERVALGTASSLVAVVRPWDMSQYLDRRLTLRPWIDLRIGRKTVVLQFRQGMDVSIRTAVPPGSPADGSDPAKVGDVELLSISTFYLGFRPARQVTFGIEAWEVYLLKTKLPVVDRDRTVFAISPGARFLSRWVEPGVSLLVPFGPPLLGAVETYVALRVDLRIWLDRKPD